MEINIVTLEFILEKKLPISYGTKLRGFFANKFEHVLFHQHKKGGSFRYNYPLIQYKIISGNPFIVGLNEGANQIKAHFSDVDELTIGKDSFQSVEGKLTTINCELFVDAHNIYDYSFHSPWIGLNQKNYKEYKNSNAKDKEKLLRRILIGNILSFATGIDWHIEKQLSIFNLDLEEVMINYKHNQLIAFKGNFKSNIYLPSNIGLGKSVSKGFGRIIRKG